MFEDNGFIGVTEEVMEPVSAGTEVVSHFRNVNDAIACEKKLKGWRRSRKIALIEQTNPQWLDLSDGWEQQPKFCDGSWETEEMI